MGTIGSAASTGDDVQTGPGFPPQAVIVCPSIANVVNTHDALDVFSVGVTAFDIDDEYSVIVSDEDDQAASDTQSLADNTALNVPNDNGAAGYEASFVSFEADGWTWNYSDATLTGRPMVVLAIGEEVAAAGVPKISKNHPMRNPILRR